MPLGPKVLFTKSPMAMAPIKDDLKEKKKKTRSKLTIIEKSTILSFKRGGTNGLTRRAVSALSSSAPALKIFTGARERDA